MNKQQNTGGAAALLTAGLFIISFIFIILIWPMYGVRGPADVSNPDVILPVVAGRPVLLAWLGINIPVAVAVSFVVLALNQRLHLHPTSLVRLALIAGLACAMFLFVVGVLRFIGYPYLANLYVNDPARAASAYARYLVTDNAFDRAAIFAAGLWLVTASWVALKVNGLSRPLSYFSMVTGIAGFIGAILPSFAPVTLLLYILWFLWYGTSEVRNRSRIPVYTYTEAN